MKMQSGVQVKIAAATCILLTAPCLSLAQAQQVQSCTVACPFAFARAQPFILQGQQERPGVPQAAPPATFSITRHGKIIFEADVRERDSSRVALTETVEISGIKSKEGWTDFVSSFVNATSRAC